MLQTIVRVCQIAFLVLATVALGWWLSGKLGGERRRELDPFQRTLAERVVAAAVAELPAREDVRRVVIPPLLGDLDDRVSDMLVERVEAAGRYEVVRPSRVEDAVKAGLATHLPTTPEEALKLARKLAPETRADGLVFGQVARDSGQRGLGAEVDLALRLVSLRPGAKVADEVVHPPAARIESRASLDYFAPWMEQVHWLWRAFLWLLFTAGLPFATFPLVQAVTAKENNRWNAALLGGLVLFDVAFAAALLGFRPGWFGGFVLLIAAFGAFIYDFAICDKIDEMRK
jgi:hypothetical protein